MTIEGIRPINRWAPERSKLVKTILQIWEQVGCYEQPQFNLYILCHQFAVQNEIERHTVYMTLFPAGECCTACPLGDDLNRPLGLSPKPFLSAFRCARLLIFLHQSLCVIRRDKEEREMAWVSKYVGFISKSSVLTRSAKINVVYQNMSLSRHKMQTNKRRTKL